MKYVILFSFLLCSCSSKINSERTSSTDNPNITVYKLFTHEGCTVYRFEDSGHYKYFTNCKGSTMYQTPSGKTTISDGVSGQ